MRLAYCLDSGLSTGIGALSKWRPGAGLWNVSKLLRLGIEFIVFRRVVVKCHGRSGAAMRVLLSSDMGNAPAPRIQDARSRSDFQPCSSSTTTSSWATDPEVTGGKICSYSGSHTYMCNQYDTVILQTQIEASVQRRLHKYNSAYRLSSSSHHRPHANNARYAPDNTYSHPVRLALIWIHSRETGGHRHLVGPIEHDTGDECRYSPHEKYQGK